MAGKVSYKALEQKVKALEKEALKLKKAECELAESEEKFRAIAEQSPNMVFINRNGRVIYANKRAEEITGYRKDEFYSPNFEFISLIAPEHRDAVKENFQKHLKGEEVESYEYALMDREGRRIDAAITTRLIKHNGDRAILGIVTDITIQKELEAQLQHGRRMQALGALAAGIAHDFNNILTVIQGNMFLMLSKKNPDHPEWKNLKNIEKQVEGWARLTRQLLQYARKGKHEVKLMDLNEMVKDSSATFGRTRRDITIHWELAEDLMSVEADEGQIAQVLLNLYINAADAMPDGGELFLTTSNVTHEDMQGRAYEPKPGRYVLLTVRDTGIGIEEEVQQRIFEPFFTTKKPDRGTGLGLASAYGIVKSHEGYIDVESEKGHGTTFSVYLPASERKSVAEEASGQFVKGRGTILLVDDDNDFLDVGVNILRHLGYKVFGANSGKEAVDFFKENKDQFDLLIIDMIMPGMSGKETFDRIKEINPAVKILLLTGYTGPGKTNKMLKSGCDGVVEKPFKIKELSQKISDILSNR